MNTSTIAFLGACVGLMLLLSSPVQAGSFEDNKENCLGWDGTSETDFYDRIKSCTFVLSFKDLPDELRRAFYFFRSKYYKMVGSESAAAADFKRSLDESTRELVEFVEKLAILCENKNAKFNEADQEVACEELKRMAAQTDE